MRLRRLTGTESVIVIAVIVTAAVLCGYFTLTGGTKQAKAEASASSVTFAASFAAALAQAPVPCGGSISAAVSSAQPGDTIGLSACAYPSTNLTSQPSSAVTIQGVAGTTINGLTFHGAANITVRDVRVTEWVVLKPANDSGGGPNPTHIHLFNVTAVNLLSRNAQDFTWDGGQIGPDQDTSPTIGSYDGLTVSKLVTLNAVHVTGITRTAKGIHVECLFIQDVDDFTWTNSRVDGCDVYDFSVGGLYGGTKNFLIRNVYFAATGNYAGQLVDGDRSSLNTPPSTGRWENDTFEEGIYNPTSIQHDVPQNSPLVGCGNVKAGSFNAWPSDPAWTAPCSGGGTTTTTQTSTTTPTTTTAGCLAPAIVGTLPTATSLTVTWQKVSGATSYKLTKTFGSTTTNSTAGKSAVSAKFGSLAYGSTTLGVQAVCGAVSSQLSTLRTVELRTTG